IGFAPAHPPHAVALRGYCAMRLGAATLKVMWGGITIGPATPAEAGEVAALYAHHVLHGSASWEVEPPDASEMAARMRRVLDAGCPWLLARDEGGAPLGYAYAAQFHPRAGYRYACEDSIYLRHDCRGQGIGSLLLAELIARCE